MQRFRPALALLLGLALATSNASAVDVVADDATDAYAISGAIVTQSGFPEAETASTCGDCHWRLIPICRSGSLEDRRQCLGLPCSSADEIVEVWRAQAALPPAVGDAAWTYLGTACITGPPLPATDVRALAADTARRALPSLRPASQPSGTTLTGLPVYFRSGQPEQFHAQPALIAGVPVIVHAQPRWTWDFGHGTPVATADPGGPRGSGNVRHIYPRRGLYRIRVSCEWTATYDVRGLTGLPVGGAITQSAWIDLRVHEARGFRRPTQGARP